MQRVTVTLDDDLMRDLDALIATKGYQNRSEAIRDLARASLRQSAIDASDGGACVAALVYVYDHRARELSKRLTQIFHGRHDLALSTLHVHLDHRSCMEIVVLRGDAAAVQRLADNIVAERGIRHGQLVLVPVHHAIEEHAHGGGKPHRHEHHHVGTASARERGSARAGGRRRRAI
jgi:CopG family nickel-responsive transcriptional regulator